VETAEPNDLEVGGCRLGELHCGLGLKTQHVDRSHRAGQVDQQPWIGALKLHEPRREPERSKAFGHRNPDLTRKRGHCPVARTQQVERRGFHLLGSGENLFALDRRAHAIDVPRDQHGIHLVLKLIDPPAQYVDRLTEALGSGAKAARADNL
jgi:hypothetical protein